MRLPKRGLLSSSGPLAAALRRGPGWAGWAMVNPLCFAHEGDCPLRLRPHPQRRMKGPCWWNALALILVRPCFSFHCLLAEPRVAGWPCLSHLPAHVPYTDTQPLSLLTHTHRAFISCQWCWVCRHWKHYAMEKKIFFSHLELEGAKSSFPLLVTRLQGAVGPGLETRTIKTALTQIEPRCLVHG